jgi:hypothetical protein
MKYKVFIDGNEIGSIKAGGIITHDLPDGEHRVHFSLDMGGTLSNSVFVSASDGDVACTIHTKVSLGGDYVELIKN